VLYQDKKSRVTTNENKIEKINDPNKV
jgi:hypothetical protein